MTVGQSANRPTAENKTKRTHYMRLNLRLPEVKPEHFELPKRCPRQKVKKNVVDAKYKQVEAWRYQCAKCGCIFRVYPQGVGKQQVSKRVNGLGGMLYLLGLSYGAVAIVLESLGIGIGKIYGECEAEVWVCDCWKAQLNAPAKVHQICLAHQVRNLQGLMEKHPRLAWAREMQALFRKAIHLRNRQEKMTERGFKRQVQLIEKQLEQLLERTSKGLGRNLLDRYRKCRDSLFIFLHRVDVPVCDSSESSRQFSFGLGRSGLCRFSNCFEYRQAK